MPFWGKAFRQTMVQRTCREPQRTLFFEKNKRHCQALPSLQSKYGIWFPSRSCIFSLVRQHKSINLYHLSCQICCCGVCIRSLSSERVVRRSGRCWGRTLTDKLARGSCVTLFSYTITFVRRPVHLYGSAKIRAQNVYFCVFHTVSSLGHLRLQQIANAKDWLCSNN